VGGEPDRPPSPTADQKRRTREEGAVTLDPLLIGVLACPEDKGPLLYFADEDRLYNPRLHRSYDVREGIPVMLIDEASAVDETEHDRLMAKADAGGSVSTGGSAGS
jgi:uncharacterized protein YbaR (Trm112 family)